MTIANVNAGKCVVFGATGKTGAAIITELASMDPLPFEQVHLVVRNTGKLPDFVFDRPEFIINEMPDQAPWSKAELLDIVKNADVVYSTLGHTSGKSSSIMLTETAKTIIDILQNESEPKEYPPRFVHLLGAAIPDSRVDKEHTPWKQRFVGRMVAWWMGDKWQDMLTSFDIVSQANGNMVETVIIRPPELTNGPKTQKYVVEKYMDLPSLRVSRKDVAHFMIELSVNQELWEQYRGYAPMITSGN